MMCIRARRLDAKLSQAQLAKAVGVAQTAVSAWEMGRYDPSVQHLCAIARACGCTIDDLFEEVPVRRAT